MKNRETEPNLTLARRIRAAGAAIYIEEDDSEAPQILPTGLRIRQFGGLIESRAFDFYGAAGYILCVAIASNLPQFSISAFELDLPYKGMVHWLDDPLEYDGSSTVYRFRGKYPLEFERDRVLNHLADVRRAYSKGQSLKGMLLGLGTEPISDEFQHGRMIPAFLIVSDQFGREYRSPVSLWADRADKLHYNTPPRIPRRGSLLDHPDRVSDPSPCDQKKRMNTKK